MEGSSIELTQQNVNKFSCVKSVSLQATVAVITSPVRAEAAQLMSSGSSGVRDRAEVLLLTEEDLLPL